MTIFLTVSSLLSGSPTPSTDLDLPPSDSADVSSGGSAERTKSAKDKHSHIVAQAIPLRAMKLNAAPSLTRTESTCPPFGQRTFLPFGNVHVFFKESTYCVLK